MPAQPVSFQARGPPIARHFPPCLPHSSPRVAH
ncbi:hypothetical protein CGRA01v4_14610 [Colletotrichum graminicola]|nr:hypothetical protein CGRA01v4_14610 [Colletotrichum graminicola]